ncbi:transposase [Alienimonas sp. DA493]|uniref:transposase n=1 Tax=Alienimonas sp. DA493 TaxID=3373605 RepID=UPI0037545D6D
MFESDRVWLLTWTLYGSRLPGDDRGFVGTVRERRVGDSGGSRVRHNGVRTEVDRAMPGLARASRELMKAPPATLTLGQADRLASQFAETAAFRGWRLLAGAIMRLHVHLLVGVKGDPDPHDLLRDFKAYGSRALNHAGKRRWWTEGGSVRKKADPKAVRVAAEYVRDQEAPLRMWLDPAVEAKIGVTVRLGEEASERLGPEQRSERTGG